MADQQTTAGPRGKAPQPDCYFCAGTGDVPEARAAELDADCGSKGGIIRAGRCLCTVSWEEISAVLPTMMQEITARG
jgi:hypothetical protein